MYKIQENTKLLNYIKKLEKNDKSIIFKLEL